MIYELNAEEREKNIKRYEADMKREEEAILEAKYYDGYYTGMEKGEKKGESRGKLKTAKRLKELGISDEIISSSTGLSLKKIKSL